MPEDKMSAPHLQIISEAHEDRIQRVEREQNELAIKTAQNTQQLGFIKEELERGFERVSEKIEECLQPILEKLEDSSEKMEEIGKKVDLHATAIGKIEDEQKRSHERWDFWKKALLTIITGAGAIGLKELVVFLSHRLG